MCIFHFNLYNPITQINDFEDFRKILTVMELIFFVLAFLFSKD